MKTLLKLTSGDCLENQKLQNILSFHTMQYSRELCNMKENTRLLLPVHILIHFKNYQTKNVSIYLLTCKII
jgi:hypothetical protein